MLRPLGEVFDAIVDPDKMKHYFISGASGAMVPKTGAEWEFGDVGAKVHVDVVTVDEKEGIVFDWSACGLPTRVTIRLQPDDANATVVVVNESTFSFDEEGAKRALGQNAGWTYTLCCLKAYLQFGINLRVGLNKTLPDV
jgi:uncharacterized protein YndB with AHSA1/START domain